MSTPDLPVPRECTSRLFTFIPGNGTVYELIVTDLGEGYVLTWTNALGGGRAATFRWDSWAAPLYLAEKLRIHPDGGDCLALGNFLEFLKKEIR